MADLDWKRRGDCAKADDPDAWFVAGAKQHAPAQLCIPCPVIAECLVYALQTRQEHGVWGGQTARQRRVLLKRHPSIDWRAALIDRR